LFWRSGGFKIASHGNGTAALHTPWTVSNLQQDGSMKLFNTHSPDGLGGMERKCKWNANKGEAWPQFVSSCSIRTTPDPADK
jgi:hypothetical protein